LSGTTDGYELLSPQQVAHLLRVAPLTIRTWWRQGWLHPPVTMKGETPKWDRYEIEAWAEEVGVWPC